MTITFANGRRTLIAYSSGMRCPRRVTTGRMLSVRAPSRAARSKEWLRTPNLAARLAADQHRECDITRTAYHCGGDVEPKRRDEDQQRAYTHTWHG